MTFKTKYIECIRYGNGAHGKFRLDLGGSICGGNPQEMGAIVCHSHAEAEAKEGEEGSDG